MFGIVNAYCDKDFNGDFIKIMKSYLEQEPVKEFTPLNAINQR